MKCKQQKLNELEQCLFKTRLTVGLVLICFLVRIGNVVQRCSDFLACMFAVEENRKIAYFSEETLPDGLGPASWNCLKVNDQSVQIGLLTNFMQAAFLSRACNQHVLGSMEIAPKHRANIDCIGQIGISPWNHWHLPSSITYNALYFSPKSLSKRSSAHLTSPLSRQVLRMCSQNCTHGRQFIHPLCFNLARMSKPNLKNWLALLQSPLREKFSAQKDGLQEKGTVKTM